MTQQRPCKNAGDDAAHQKRPAIFPGPRCSTCHRESRKAAKQKAHATRVARVYGLSPGDYDLLYAAQGGVCAICLRATGASRRLSVDHDHGCCPGSTSCGRCVRGILCRPCNDLLGHLRDDPDVFSRVAEYLRRPPAHAVLLAAD